MAHYPGQTSVPPFSYTPPLVVPGGLGMAPFHMPSQVGSSPMMPQGRGGPMVSQGGTMTVPPQGGSSSQQGSTSTTTTTTQTQNTGMFLNEVHSLNFNFYYYFCSGI
jgi:hypothetical protein